MSEHHTYTHTVSKGTLPVNVTSACRQFGVSNAKLDSRASTVFSELSEPSPSSLETEEAYEKGAFEMPS